MNAGRPSSLDGIPTLTEVVSWPDPAGDAAADSAVTAAAAGATAHAEPVPAAQAGAARPGTQQAFATAAVPTPLDEKQFSQRLLAEVQRQVELMLEVRLRESLAPVLSRAADAMVREARKELTSAMREVVSRAIAEESARRRS